ncbi:MAG: hypothetical protein RLZZ529_1558 [Bacteroidota bacterium]|jgi:hypothetical protein
MKELDLLKKDWQKSEASFEQLSEKDIYVMLHKKSSSVVKWILIVSILEFVILNGIGWFLPDPYQSKYNQLHPYLSIAENLNYFIILGFIYLFFKNYKTISVLNNATLLIKHILKTRKIVNYYIYWNILISGFIGAFGFIDGWNNSNTNVADIPNHGTAMVIPFAIAMFLIMLFIWGFYKLLYGNFLGKLKTNYEELQKMES